MKHLRTFLLTMLSFINFVSAEELPFLHQLKDSAYRRDIYPHDQTLLIDLLHRAETIDGEQNTHTYIRAVLKTFINIAKGSQYITSHSFNVILETLADFLPKHFQTKKYAHYLKNQPLHELDMLNRLKTINKNILLNELKDNFDALKRSPTNFLDNMANQLVDVAQEEIELQQLRHTLMMFLEVHLNKLIWAPEDQEDTWTMVKTMADTLAVFAERDILDDINYLDDTYWTLIHRYCHFIELTHTLLHKELFNAIKQDLANGNIFLLELEEQDTCLEKRGDCILNTVMRAEARKQAYERGIA